MPPSNTIATTDPKQHQQQNGNGKPKEMMKLEQPTTSIVVPPDGGWGWVVSFRHILDSVISSLVNAFSSRTVISVSY